MREAVRAGQRVRLWDNSPRMSTRVPSLAGCITHYAAHPPHPPVAVSPCQQESRPPLQPVVPDSACQTDVPDAEGDLPVSPWSQTDK